MIAAPDGWPLWVSPVRPGCEHDVTAARTHEGLLEALEAFTDHPTRPVFALADLGYKGERSRLLCPFKTPKVTVPDRRRRSGKNVITVPLSEATKVVNALHAAMRARVEQANARLKMTFAARRHVSRSPWRISATAAAALVLLHTEHHRTT